MAQLAYFLAFEFLAWSSPASLVAGIIFGLQRQGSLILGVHVALMVVTGLGSLGLL